MECAPFWRWKASAWGEGETPPNNGIPPGHPAGVFEVLFVFIRGRNWNRISVWGVGSISDGKNK